MIRLALPLAAGLALASCGQVAPENSATGPAEAPRSGPVGQANDQAPVANRAAPATPPFAETSGAHPSAPEPAPIPVKFRGTWAASKAACADLADQSRLEISGRTVRFHDYVIFGDEFTFPTPRQFALKGHIEATGAPAEAHYMIDASGEFLTDEAGGGAVRVKCG